MSCGLLNNLFLFQDILTSGTKAGLGNLIRSSPHRLFGVETTGGEADKSPMIHVLIVEKTSSDQRIVASSRNRLDNPTSSGTSSTPTTTTATTATTAKTAKTWSEDSFTSEATAHFAALGMNTTHARVQEHGPWTNVNIGWIAGSVYIIFSVWREIFTLGNEKLHTET